MSKINSRSPYYVTHTISSSTVTSVRLNLWIYTGTQTTSRPAAATYTLESTPINGSVQFDIANLVKDYFEPSHTSSEILWVDYRIDENKPEPYYKGIFDENNTNSGDNPFLYYLSDDLGVSPRIGSIMYEDDLNGTPVSDLDYFFTDSNGGYNKVTLNTSGVVQSVVSDAGSGTTFTGRSIVEYGTVANSYVFVTGATIIQLEGFYGYGYFEDGANPQVNDGLLLSSDCIIRNENEDIKIPYNNNKGNLKVISLKIGLLTVQGVATSTSTDSSTVIEYITEDSAIDEITFSGGRTIKVESYCETKYNPYKVTFINKYGALEDVWFFKNNKIDLNVETESFRRNIVSGGSYSLQDHQYHTLKKQGRETITLNSGFYPEGANETFRQLLFSDYAWVTHEGNVLPIQIKDSSFNFKTRLTDRVINYTMQFEFAFDKINTVR